MMFFYIAVVIVALYFYAGWAMPTARRAYRETRETIERDTDVFVHAVISPMYLIAAPILRHHFRKSDEEARIRRREEKAQALQRAFEVRRKADADENARREPLREEWIKQNETVLYRKVMNGLTVIMTPAAYDACVERTEEARCNGLWEAPNTLMPSRDAFVFFNKTGRELICQNVRTSDPIHYSYASEWVGRLLRMKKDFNLRFEDKEEIFVPYFSEVYVPWSEQRKNNDVAHLYISRLVYAQMPEEIRPVCTV